MRKHKNTYVALLLSTIVLGQVAGGIAAPSSEAAGTTPAAATTATVKVNPIQLGQGVTAALEDVNIWPQMAAIFWPIRLSSLTTAVLVPI